MHLFCSNSKQHYMEEAARNFYFVLVVHGSGYCASHNVRMNGCHLHLYKIIVWKLVCRWRPCKFNREYGLNLYGYRTVSYDCKQF